MCQTISVHRGWSMDYGGLAAVDVSIPTVPSTPFPHSLTGWQNRHSVAEGMERTSGFGKGDIGLMDLARAFSCQQRA